MPSLKHIPREIFDFIVNGLSPNHTKSAADAFLFSESQENRLWTAIFKDDSWIEKAFELRASPALIGPKLRMIGTSGCKSSQRHHILLVTNDLEGDLQYKQDIFFQSLRAGYVYDETKSTVTLPEMRSTGTDNRKINLPEIVLYVREAISSGGDIIYLPNRVIQKLFEKHPVRSQYSFAWERKIREIQETGIHGMEGKISKPNALIPICVFYLDCCGKKWQTVLQGPRCPRVSPIMSDGIGGDIVGWEKGI